jgi:Peptidase inhibitor family I36
MRTHHDWRLPALLFAASVLGLLVTTTAKAQDGGRERGGPRTFDCIGYEHRDFRGATITENAGRGWKYVGDRWNDKISSFRMRNGCRVIAYQHRDYKGDSTVFRGDHKFVGDLWNDQISSWKCMCN